MAMVATLSGLGKGHFELSDIAGALRSLFPGKPAKQAENSWVEISPYGFLSRNYFSYVSGNLKECSITSLPDGTRVTCFPDGSFILEAASGHIVELDRRRRAVLAKVKKSEAQGAKLALGRNELSECFHLAVNKQGQQVMVLPGNILVREAGQQVVVTFPNGSEFLAKKCD